MNTKDREIFANLSIFPPIFVRLDGRAFHRLTRALDLTAPFDPAFHASMRAVCRYLLEESGFTPTFAYTFSDEISLYFQTLPFSGRVEKIDSVTASAAASVLTIGSGAQSPWRSMPGSSLQRASSPLSTSPGGRTKHGETTSTPTARTP